MQKRLIALAALTLVSGIAAAQSTVTIYGNVDVGLLTQNNAPAGGSSTSIANGGIAPSIWGLRGSEDLGNGLKANFNLEAHFAADTGAGTGTTAFRRQSNVALSSASLGTLTLGNQYGPAVLAFAATDPRGLRENFSGLYSWAYNSGALTTGNNGNNDVGVFLQNAIAYNTTIGPVGVGAAYSFSENKGALLSLGATYTGPVSVSASYQSTEGTASSEKLSTMYSLGAGYTFGALTGKINMLHSVNKNTALAETSSVDVIGLGVDWKMSANNTVMAAIYSGKNKNNSADETTTLILSDEYALSKRTTVYGTLAFANAKSGATLLTTMVAGGTMADTNTNLFNIGIKHSF